MARGGSAGVRVAGGLSHGDGGEDHRVDGVGAGCTLKVRVVLGGAGGADAAVELVEADVDYVREGEVRGVQPSPVMPGLSQFSGRGLILAGKWD